ncbi:MAG TPA: type II toxin-antitoxin system HicA family toxin [Terracidiphilus sp.]|nr:type II toxin-antitoxin system HicA family toxin [Terracidiphilus sp.]
MGFSDLPEASGTEHQKTLEKLGWVCRRKAEHIIMTHPNHPNPISIPNHRKVKKATLKAILRGIGITDRQYRAFFES